MNLITKLAKILTEGSCACKSFPILDRIARTFDHIFCVMPKQANVTHQTSITFKHTQKPNQKFHSHKIMCFRNHHPNVSQCETRFGDDIFYAKIVPYDVVVCCVMDLTDRVSSSSIR